MKSHNKLVRDRIPEIIEKVGGEAVYRELSDDEFKSALIEKLYEEVDEFVNATSDEDRLEELADITEVIRGILFAMNVEPVKLEAERLIKKRRRGGFTNRIYLVATL